MRLMPPRLVGLPDFWPLFGLFNYFSHLWVFKEKLPFLEIKKEKI
jgi:hypothetical protein